MTQFGELRAQEIEELLHAQFVARIGCQRGGRPYVVPVTYAYDGTYMYGYTPAGLKLALMRAAPWVCFEIDEVRDAGYWRSVIAYGKFEALADHEAYLALELLSARLRIESAAAGKAVSSAATFVARRGDFGIAYRIKLLDKTGRFARPPFVE